jgi:hypothetical protein
VVDLCEKPRQKQNQHYPLKSLVSPAFGEANNIKSQKTIKTYSYRLIFLVNCKKMIRLFFLFFFFIPTYLSAQNLALGHWRDHLNYTRTKSVAVAGNKIYCATENSLFYYNTEDNSLEKLSKINGLSDMGFEFISYNEETSSLLVVYQNSNIDLIKNGRTTNISDIRRANIVGDKKIYSVSYDKHLAYLATGFGVVALDLKRMEFRGTYYYASNGAAQKTLNTFLFDDKIYAAAENALYSAPLNSPNLADFNSWSRMGSFPWGNNLILEVKSFNNKLFALVSGTSTDSVYLYDDNNWIAFDIGAGRVSGLFPLGDQLCIIKNNKIHFFNRDLSEELVLEDFKAWMNPTPKEITYGKGSFWVADGFLGLVKYDKIVDKFEIIRINGPETNAIKSLTVAGDKLYVAPGGVKEAFSNLWNGDDVSVYHDFKWNNIYSTYLPNKIIMDKMHVAVDPKDDKHIFISSWHAGILEVYDREVVTLHNQDNAPMDYWLFGINDTIIRIGQSIFDKDNNMWALNNTSLRPLLLKTPENKWHSFALPGRPTQDNELEKMIITQNNHLWITMPRNKSIGLFCYNHNNTPEDPSDDKFVAITTEKGSGSLPTAFVRSLAEDLDGRIWVGTDQGVVVFNNPAAVFNADNFDGQQVLIKQDGNFQILLENESVTAIAIDGANRKWFGTAGGGVFLMSSDGTEEIAKFNIQNSPLLSNNIFDIAITKDGEVFFGTEKGLISYKGTATFGGSQFSQVYAFPNPVTPEHEGVIAIRGLASASSVKITDVNGNLVYETKALGGQAIWDGRTRYGEKAATGVYLVFAANRDGSIAVATKIMIIN